MKVCNIYYMTSKGIFIIFYKKSWWGKNYCITKFHENVIMMETEFKITKKCPSNRRGQPYIFSFPLLVSHDTFEYAELNAASFSEGSKQFSCMRMQKMMSLIFLMFSDARIKYTCERTMGDLHLSLLISQSLSLNNM